ncbi:hypothetical protein HX109_11005 [Galbibacter sp. BG1]|uniref:interleukin-like EMT inducer domain-containing protein n=1 Tax=Galbibacter sp. BG1 TaxID=1170699 RepID=UPI0015BB05C2|nr:interleukin-like EMT inducer domain-containing protein [Galbibacter sp. BG1]QLE02057.1 hypothetical protein HX109_11005 [Galbibacter sp. BG1]
MKIKVLTVLALLVFHLQNSLAQSSLYARGTGYNNFGSRMVKLDGNYLVHGSGRGLCLTIIDASLHQHVSSTVYDTYGSEAASNDLAIALNNLKRGQIGLLTSFDAWEDKVTNSLRIAARRLGLYKLIGGLGYGNRKPYVAIFRGAGVADGNTEPNHVAYEVMQSRDVGADQAVIATWLVEDAFVGNNLTNALISANSNISDASVIVDQKGDVGIGTYTPDEKLTVNGTMHAKEVKIDINVPAPDYVFEEDYKLRSLKELKKYIEIYGHLPEIPSAEEIAEEGISVGEMNMLLLKKIEELTLYILIMKQKL